MWDVGDSKKQLEGNAKDVSEMPMLNVDPEDLFNNM